jgi:hypothetical protein
MPNESPQISSFCRLFAFIRTKLDRRIDAILARHVHLVDSRGTHKHEAQYAQHTRSPTTSKAFNHADSILSTLRGRGSTVGLRGDVSCSLGQLTAPSRRAESFTPRRTTVDRTQPSSVSSKWIEAQHRSPRCAAPTGSSRRHEQPQRKGRARLVLSERRAASTQQIAQENTRLRERRTACVNFIVREDYSSTC